MNISAIEGLDLTRLTDRLQKPPNKGKGWTPSQAQYADKWYRRFLVLAVKYPNIVLVPTEEVDELWHMHVLDMDAYDKDMNRILGRKLFHTPLFSGEDMSKEFAETQLSSSPSSVKPLCSRRVTRQPLQWWPCHN